MSLKTLSLQLGLAACLSLARAPRAFGEEFSLNIGSPVASQSFQAKSSAFVFRTNGCADPAKAEVTGAAEGLVQGERRSVRLAKLTAAPVPGVYAVFREWPAEGIWVVSLTAKCAGSTAAALVPMGPKGFIRESSKFFSRAATEAEIAAALKSLANDQPSAKPRAEITPDGENLVAHEWGTFTSVAGEDGGAVRWAPLLGPADLPCFVSRLSQQNPKSIPGFVRMETPVLYFYSKRAMLLDVRVDFPQGWITEWYPRATGVMPSSPNLPPQAGYRNGRIEWNSLQVLPQEDPALPSSKAASHYYAARETDSAPLRIAGQWEKLLFYRGIGDFEVPLRASFARGGKLTIRNAGSDPIPFVILFENRAGKLGHRMARGLKDVVELDPPDLTGNLEQLRQELADNLVEFGLYRKEALAMIETWRDSWFEQGMRVFYIVPRSQVDAVLPLQITPAPAASVRVFVGRVEVLSPWMRQAIETASDEGNVAALIKLGRFLDPFAAQMQRSSSRPLIQAIGNLFQQQISGPRCVE